ncbi:MAG: Vitamin B12 import ATP-binding protein BtuD [Myxococcota bacterium]|nr:Vitamin B12 import ATP-binding protein BtuD [Myxococcota bacterium]
MNPVLEIQGVSKVYHHPGKPPKQAIRNISFSAQPGEAIALLGHNGAGKSTLFRCILGLHGHDGGTIRIGGHPPGSMAAQALIGYLPEKPFFQEYLTGRELMHFHAVLAGVPSAQIEARTDELLRRVELHNDAGKPIRKYSKGMQQRIGVAQALLGDPKLLILDEPLSGLDPLGRNLVRNLINEERAKGRAVLFSSHVLADAERSCDRALILVRGELRRDISTGPAFAGLDPRRELVAAGAPGLADEVRRKGLGVEETGGVLRIELPGPELFWDLKERITALGGRVLSFGPRRRHLEDLYLAEHQ